MELINTSTAFFVFTMFFSLSVVTISAYFGKIWIYVAMVALTLTSTITAGKIIELDLVWFTVSASAATPIFASLFLATDILSEFYTESDAKKSIWFAFAANIILLIGGQLVSSSPTTLDSPISTSLDNIFGFVPRLLLGGITAYIVSQNLDIFIFGYMKKMSKNKRGVHLIIRNNTSTMISQFFDSVIVYSIAFYGIIDNLTQVILVAWGMKITVAFFDTFFIMFMSSFIPEKAEQKE